MRPEQVGFSRACSVASSLPAAAVGFLLSAQHTTCRNRFVGHPASRFPRSR